MSTDKKYALFPGPVTSARDGQRCHVTAWDLAELYGVRMDECVIAHGVGMGPYRPDITGLIWLQPRADGDYRLPSEKTPEGSILGARPDAPHA